LIAASIIIAIIRRFPRLTVSHSLSSPDSTLEIKVGDLFDETGHLVIGTNDVFDSELGDVIKASSVQGQFLTRIYDGGCAKFDADIEQALAALAAQRHEDSLKIQGKRWRYPLGTTIVLGSLPSRYFLVAYGYMGNNLQCNSDADTIQHSLSCLWNEIRLKGQGSPVAIPVIGSDLARTNIPRMMAVKMIILSFIVASKEKFIADKLTVVIHPKDIASVNLYALQEFLTSACY
jgi:hypothetical protein